MRINKGKKKTDDDSSSDAFPKLGDIVEITFSLRTSEGQILQDEDEADPVTFEVGAADVVGNPLFKARLSSTGGLSFISSDSMSGR